MCIGQCSKCGDSPSNIQKWRWTLYTTLLFILIVSPVTYKFVDSLLSGFIGKIAKNGCPTPVGIFIHAIVFTLILRGMMDIDL